MPGHLLEAVPPEWILQTRRPRHLAPPCPLHAGLFGLTGASHAAASALPGERELMREALDLELREARQDQGGVPGREGRERERRVDEREGGAKGGARGEDAEQRAAPGTQTGWCQQESRQGAGDH